MRGWLKPKTAAEYADVSERTVRTWLKSEGLRSSRVGGSILIKVGWLEEFLEQREISPQRFIDQVVEEVCEGLTG